MKDHYHDEITNSHDQSEAYHKLAIPDEVESIIHDGIEMLIHKDLIRSDVHEWHKENNEIFISCQFDEWFKHILERDFRETFRVLGAGGLLTCDLETGDVIECEALKPKASAVSYNQVLRIDVKELKKYMGATPLKGSTVGIEAVGLWLKDGTYQNATNEETEGTI
jgi:hypothetical protein